LLGLAPARTIGFGMSTKALAALLLSIAACSSDPLETVMCIRAEPRARARATEIAIRVEDARGETTYERTAPLGDRRWPLSLPVTPAGDAAPFAVHVDLSDAAGAFLAKAIAGTYGDSGLSAIDASLEDACIGVAACVDGETCVAGACTAIEPPVLRRPAARSLEAACPLDCSFDVPVHVGAPLSTAENDPPVVPSFDASEVFVMRSSPAGADTDIYLAERLGPLEFGPLVPVANVNSSSNEIAGSISSDGLTLYLLSNRSGAPRLYTASRRSTGEPFAEPVELAIEGASALSLVAPPVLSSDDLSLFVAAGSADIDLYASERADRAAAFGPLVRIDALSTAGSERELAVGPDGLAFYQHVPEGEDRAHIWTADFDLATRTFSNPRVWELSDERLGEYAPRLSRDGTELWLGLHVGDGLGGIDLFLSRRACVP
jgi:hypothetical protein